MRTTPDNITEDLLIKFYIEDQKSLREIGIILKKSPKQISRYLTKFGIKARPFSTKGTVGWAKGIPKSKNLRKKISNAHKGKKLSVSHRNKVIKTLRSGVYGKDNVSWKGGVFVNPKGYIYIRKPEHPNVQSNGYVAQHRLVMEEKIGRLINSFEHVHHINGVKHDNRPENLELVNAHTHNLITMLENRIRSLEEENKSLKNLLSA